MNRIGVHLIFGANPEPFLEAALRSVGWADYVCAVDTSPIGSVVGMDNADVVRATVPADRLRIADFPMEREEFDFARARNACLHLADEGDWVLILDADDVHYPEFEDVVRKAVAEGHDSLTAHFWHLAVYKDLLHSERHREIVFQNGPGVYFRRGVHELLEHPRLSSVLIPGSYHYAHYGYIKPAREIADRWELYRELGAEIHDYDVDQPDRAMDDWPRVCKPFWREHPPAAQAELENWPSAPITPKPARPTRIALVMLTWNDSDRLQQCLPSLRTTTEPFDLYVVDNGSTDRSTDMVRESFPNAIVHRMPGKSLAEALNIGFGQTLHEGISAGGSLGPYDYAGWIHPDMVFDWPDWLENLASEMDAHPEWVKLGAQESNDGNRELRSGNSQCYIVRREALWKVGLFDERFLACGGYEDWEHNRRLMGVGDVMITPMAQIHHHAMGTRSNHDNDFAARRNAEIYHEICGTWDPPC